MAKRVAVSELVASLMAEGDGKNRENHVLVAKGVAIIHGKFLGQEALQAPWVTKRL